VVFVEVLGTCGFIASTLSHRGQPGPDSALRLRAVDLGVDPERKTPPQKAAFLALYLK
jgi:hypothetical protein